MNKISEILKSAALCAALLSVSACYANGGSQNTAVSSEEQLSEAGLKLLPLTVESGSQTHQFTVELAETLEQQARGLMFRRELAPDMGMIFPFPEDKLASFWMKNVPISIDIIFIRRDGTIESITANAEPYSTASLSAGEPVAAVLEIAAGRAAELGIKPGDIVRW